MEVFMKKILLVISIIFCLTPQLKAMKKGTQKYKHQIVVKKTRKQKQQKPEQTAIKILIGLIESGQPLPDIINPALLRKIVLQHGQKLLELALEKNNTAAADQLSSWAGGQILQTTSEAATMENLGAQLGSLEVPEEMQT
jgi:hypothetical protein